MVDTDKKKSVSNGKKPSRRTVNRMAVTKSPEILASETLLAVVLSDTISQAAEKLGITRQMVHERINKYGLKEKIQALREEASIELHLGANKAAQRLVGLVDSQDEAIAKDASKSVLDRIGLTKADSTEPKGNTFLINKANFSSKKYLD